MSTEQKTKAVRFVDVDATVLDADPTMTEEVATVVHMAMCCTAIVVYAKFLGKLGERLNGSDMENPDVQRLHRLAEKFRVAGEPYHTVYTSDDVDDAYDAMIAAKHECALYEAHVKTLEADATRFTLEVKTLWKTLRQTLNATDSRADATYQELKTKRDAARFESRELWQRNVNPLEPLEQALPMNLSSNVLSQQILSEMTGENMQQTYLKLMHVWSDDDDTWCDRLANNRYMRKMIMNKMLEYAGDAHDELPPIEHVCHWLFRFGDESSDWLARLPNMWTAETRASDPCQPSYRRECDEASIDMFLAE